MDEIEKQFSLIDYILFTTLLGISFIIGIASACKGNKSPEEFLLGNRSLGPIPVAMSLLTSVISAINIVGYTSEVYSFGTQLSLVSVGCIFGIAFSILVVMPVIHPLKLTSIHEVS
ncbi:Sodium-dependent multivitamin transporter, partial [Armadillidium nasatum]